jgi:LuxR family maltose regulon positive regulatory protein
VRVFLDEGQPMKMLLAQWLTQNNTSLLMNYASHLLIQFDAEPHGDTVATSLRQTLAEPLSPRELEVLHLVALGKTNQEIAEELVVARGTIKAHAASIYRKLNVTNRTEAVARARQLSILS